MSEEKKNENTNADQAKNTCECAKDGACAQDSEKELSGEQPELCEKEACCKKQEHCEKNENEKGEKCEKKKKLFAEIDELKKEAEENKRKWYAVTAEYENYRRRTEKQSATRYAEGRNDVVAALFPVGDNLERALSSCKDEQTKKGLEMVLKSFEKVLTDEGIEAIDPTGKAFSADEAEAIMAVPAENGEESGTVKQVYLKGYKKGDKVLRYAQVIVVS